MIRITPKISVRPDANSAYTPPISSPRSTVWTRRVTGRSPSDRYPPPPASAPRSGRPLRLGVDDGLGCGDLLGKDDLRLGPLPLRQQERLLGRPRLVPRQRSQERLDLVRVQVVLDRLLVDLADGFDRRLEHLRRRERVRRVLRGDRALELLPVRGHEFLVHQRVGV